jgi:hypothetical protein
LPERRGAFNMSRYNVISGSDKVPPQTKNEFLAKLIINTKPVEKNYSECCVCGMPIAKGDYMCDDCYWTIREG